MLIQLGLKDICTKFVMADEMLVHENLFIKANLFGPSRNLVLIFKEEKHHTGAAVSQKAEGCQYIPSKKVSILTKNEEHITAGMEKYDVVRLTEELVIKR